jgi:hypothetical protein
MKLTDSQRKHLHWLIDRGGSAYIANGYLTASGEDCPSKIGPTWLYLVAHGLRHADSLSRKR